MTQVYAGVDINGGLCEVGGFRRPTDWNRDEDLPKLEDTLANEVGGNPAFATTTAHQRFAYRSLAKCGFRRIASWQNPNTGARITLWWRRPIMGFQFANTPEAGDSWQCCGLSINEQGDSDSFGNDDNPIKVPGLFVTANNPRFRYNVPIQKVGKYFVYLGASDVRLRRA